MANTILPIIETIVGPFLSANYNKNNFKVFLSDGASYCRKLGNLLKNKNKCHHLICSCHNMHNFSEFLRKKYVKVDNLISFLKRILVKNKTDRKIWKITTNIELLKWPIITRWGT